MPNIQQYRSELINADLVVQSDTSAIWPMAASARGEMALVSNCTTTHTDVEERLDTSAIWPMAASARGEMVGARGISGASDVVIVDAVKAKE